MTNIYIHIYKHIKHIYIYINHLKNNKILGIEENKKNETCSVFDLFFSSFDALVIVRTFSNLKIH